MEIIKNIPVNLEPGEVARRLHIRPERARESQLEDLLDLTRPLIDLRAVYDISFVGHKAAETVEVAGVVFRSRVLRANLEHAQKVFPYIMTIGPALEQKAASLGDLLKQYYLEEIANFALHLGSSWLAEKLKARWGFTVLSDMSPGSLEDWPISEQRPLFSLFGDTEKTVGVRLTDHMLMLPRKSISGIFFPTEESFTACELCPREKCPSRRAPYDEAKAAEYHTRELGE
jgi:hypothetical protein